MSRKPVFTLSRSLTGFPHSPQPSLQAPLNSDHSIVPLLTSLALPLYSLSSRGIPWGSGHVWVQQSQSDREQERGCMCKGRVGVGTCPSTILSHAHSSFNHYSHLERRACQPRLSQSWVLWNACVYCACAEHTCMRGVRGGLQRPALLLSIFFLWDSVACATQS